MVTLTFLFSEIDVQLGAYNLVKNANINNTLTTINRIGTPIQVPLFAVHVCNIAKGLCFIIPKYHKIIEVFQCFIIGKHFVCYYVSRMHDLVCAFRKYFKDRFVICK